MLRALLPATLTATIAATLAVPATAQSSYRQRGLLRTGYSDRRVGPDQWEVRASSHDEGGSVPVALYHAAAIADANGIAELRIVRQQVKISRVVMRSSGATVGLTEKTIVTVRAVRTDADRIACDMPEARRCLTLPVAGLMSAYGPGLGMPAARAGETPRAPVLLTTTGSGWPFAATPAAVPNAGPFASLLNGLLGRQSSRPAPPTTDVPLPAAVKVMRTSFKPATSVPVAIPALRPSAPLARSGAAASPAVLPTGAGRGVPLARVATNKPSYEDRLRAARPVDGDPRLGWSASD